LLKPLPPALPLVPPALLEPLFPPALLEPLFPPALLEPLPPGEVPVAPPPLVSGPELPVLPPLFADPPLLPTAVVVVGVVEPLPPELPPVPLEGVSPTAGWPVSEGPWPTVPTGVPECPALPLVPWLVEVTATARTDRDAAGRALGTETAEVCRREGSDRTGKPEALAVCSAAVRVIATPVRDGAAADVFVPPTGTSANAIRSTNPGIGTDRPDALKSGIGSRTATAKPANALRRSGCFDSAENRTVGERPAAITIGR
jgi:hypothetical protein